MRRLLSLGLIALMLLPAVLADEEISLFGPGLSTVAPAPAAATQEPEPAAAADEDSAAQPASTPEPQQNAARDQLIDRMIGLAKELYDGARGRAQKAASAADI